jgi:HJR/Mrr/RecB family endonuclease
MDYYFKVQAMDEKDLLDEIEKIHKMLFKSNPGPMANQLQDMLATVQDAYRDMQYTRRIKKEDSVLEIGTIEESVNEKSYSDTELVNIMVTSYTQGSLNETGNVK